MCYILAQVNQNRWYSCGCDYTLRVLILFSHPPSQDPSWVSSGGINLGGDQGERC